MAMSALPLKTLNHVSLVCSNVTRSSAFYCDLLGFEQVKRPASFEFDGCWLYGLGIGLHLIRGCPVKRPKKIDPLSDHFSFQSDQIEYVLKKLKMMKIEFVMETVREGDISITQVFFHDPDHNMIEVCNCERFPVIPIVSHRSSMDNNCSDWHSRH